MSHYSEALRNKLHEIIGAQKIRAQEDVVDRAVANGFEDETVRYALADLFKEGALVERPVELGVGKVHDFEVDEDKMEKILFGVNEGIEKS